MSDNNWNGLLGIAWTGVKGQVDNMYPVAAGQNGQVGTMYCPTPPQ